MENSTINNVALTNIKETLSRVFTIVGKVFFVVGIILIGIGIYFFVDDINFNKSSKTVDATITTIHLPGQIPATVNERRMMPVAITVEYTIEGNKYERILNHYNTTMYVGRVITIKYNSDNHNDIRYSQGFVYYVLFLIGAVLGISGMALVISIKRKQNKRNPYE